jgi:ABC-type sugar transport system substrate-binding protein
MIMQTKHTILAALLLAAFATAPLAIPASAAAADAAQAQSREGWYHKHRFPAGYTQV